MSFVSIFLVGCPFFLSSLAVIVSKQDRPPASFKFASQADQSSGHKCCSQFRNRVVVIQCFPLPLFQCFRSLCRGFSGSIFRLTSRSDRDIDLINVVQNSFLRFRNPISIGTETNVRYRLMIITSHTVSCQACTPSIRR